MTILNFNNLMKIFQDTQEELKKLLPSHEKNDEVEEELTTIEKIIIETYNGDGYNDDDSSSDSCSQNGNIASNYCEEKHIIENIEIEVKKSPISPEKTVVINSRNQNESANGTEIDSKKYSCDECGDVFLIRSGFIHHMVHKHNICIPIEKCELYSSDVKIKLPNGCTDKVLKFVQKLPSQPTKKFRFQCQICQKGFETNSDLKVHYNIHKTFKCDQCGAAFIKKSYLKDHMLVHTMERKYVCNVCGKGFKYRNGLSVHKNVHVNQRSHICEACGQGFNARTTLLTHMRLKHNVNEKQYTCPECGVIFKVKSWLDKHFQRKHTKNRTKDFICAICGVAYLNKYTLTRHMNDKHLGNAKRYDCHICEKNYTMRNKLISHLQLKHSVLSH